MGVKADVRGRGRTEWPFGGPIGTVHTRKIGHFTGPGGALEEQ